MPIVRVPGAKVEPTLLTATKLARAAMLDFLPNANEQTSSNIKNMISKRGVALCQCDRFARIEMLFFGSFMDEGHNLGRMRPSCSASRRKATW